MAKDDNKELAKRTSLNPEARQVYALLAIVDAIDNLAEVLKHRDNVIEVPLSGPEITPEEVLNFGKKREAESKREAAERMRKKAATLTLPKTFTSDHTQQSIDKINQALKKMGIE